MCHKMRLSGGKQLTPIFLVYSTPKEAMKTIKSIWATEMVKITNHTRLNDQIVGLITNVKRWC